MASIRLRTGDYLPAPGIPLPDQGGIRIEGFGRGQLMWIVFGPKSRLNVSEGGNSALGGYTSACQRDDLLG